MQGCVSVCITEGDFKWPLGYNSAKKRKKKPSLRCGSSRHNVEGTGEKREGWDVNNKQSLARNGCEALATIFRNTI